MEAAWGGFVSSVSGTVYVEQHGQVALTWADLQSWT
jgi:hypothetical protein